MNNTPLRYPGGKSKMTSFFDRLIIHNCMRDVIYSEAYAGGAGTAINLLLSNKVGAVRINDAAIGIFSFWNSLVSDGVRFLDKLNDIKIDLMEWKQQRHIFKTSREPSFELGFATFYLSRTNRSGILNAGPIGGQDERVQESAKYKIDCRFNKEELLKRIQKIVDNRNRIYVTNEDALFFLNTIRDENALVYLDPPYYAQGKALYLNYYQHQDHENLANYLRNRATFNWVLSYDNVPAILDLYVDFPLYQFDLSYTAQEIRRGSELLTHSYNIGFPNLPTIKRRGGNISILQIV